MSVSKYLVSVSVIHFGLRESIGNLVCYLEAYKLSRYIMSIFLTNINIRDNVWENNLFMIKINFNNVFNKYFNKLED